jgi:hypothetical protein
MMMVDFKTVSQSHQSEEAHASARHVMGNSARSPRSYALLFLMLVPTKAWKYLP